MSDQQQRITLAQSVNIAKDIAIAQKGSKVTVPDVAALVEEIYTVLFKETCNAVARNQLKPVEPTDASTFITLYKNAPDPIEFRNNNRSLLASFSKEDRDVILKSIGE